MARLTLKTPTADLQVLSCALTLPGFGAWYAQIIADTSDPADLVGLATLEIVTDKATRLFSGIILQASTFGARGTLRLLAGRGGLIQPLPPKDYKNAPARLVAQDICTEADELLDPTSTNLDTLLPLYVRSASLASAQLSQLARVLAQPWHVTDSGQVKIGPRPATVFDGEVTVLSENPFTQTQALDLPNADLSPGQLLDDRPIDRVEYSFVGDAQSAMIRLGI